MFPELFHIPGTAITIHSFGVMLVLGLYAGLILMKWLAGRAGLDGEQFVNVGILALVSGLVGARLSHVLENLSAYTNPNRSAWENLLAAINISAGGLTFYGGFLLALPVCTLYLLWRKIPLRTALDICTPAVMVGLAFGRIGCFANGCCYGAEADLPWSVTFPYGSIAWYDQYNRGEIKLPPELLFRGEDGLLYPKPPSTVNADPALKALAARYPCRPLHPAQLYSSLVALLLAAICTTYFLLPHAPGRVLALMMMLEGIARFLLESVRAEPAVVRYTLGGHPVGLSFSMVLGLGIVGVGMLLWLVFAPPRPVPTPPQDRSPPLPPLPA